MFSRYKLFFYKHPFGVISSGTLGLILAVNHSEEYRMKRNVINGKYAFKSPSKDFKKEFSMYSSDLIEIENMLKSKRPRVIGLMGDKDMGKSSTLEYIASQHQSRSIYFKYEIPHSVCIETLVDRIYYRMEEEIWTLPFMLRWIRLSWSDKNEEVVHRILQKIGSDGKKVNIFIDTKEDDVNEKDRYSRILRKEELISQAKKLVQDLKLANCIFVCNYKYMEYESLNLKNSALALFAQELSIDIAKAYLKEKYNYICKDEDDILKMIPRTYFWLDYLGETTNKEAFAKRVLNTQIQEIVKLSSASSSLPSCLWKILNSAMNGEVDENFSKEDGNLTVREFCRKLVDIKVLQPTGANTFKIQSDCARSAIQIIMENYEVVNRIGFKNKN